MGRLCPRRPGLLYREPWLSPQDRRCGQQWGSLCARALFLHTPAPGGRWASTPSRLTSQLAPGPSGTLEGQPPCPQEPVLSGSRG